LLAVACLPRTRGRARALDQQTAGRRRLLRSCEQVQGISANEFSVLDIIEQHSRFGRTFPSTLPSCCPDGAEPPIPTFPPREMALRPPSATTQPTACRPLRAVALPSASHRPWPTQPAWTALTVACPALCYRLCYRRRSDGRFAGDTPFQRPDRGRPQRGSWPPSRTCQRAVRGRFVERCRPVDAGRRQRRQALAVSALPARRLSSCPLGSLLPPYSQDLPSVPHSLRLALSFFQFFPPFPLSAAPPLRLSPFHAPHLPPTAVHPIPCDHAQPHPRAHHPRGRCRRCRRHCLCRCVCSLLPPPPAAVLCLFRRRRLSLFCV